MKIVLFFFFAFLVFDLFTWWSGARFLRRTGARRALRLAFHGFLGFQMAAILAIGFARSRDLNIDMVLPTSLAIVVYLWHLMVAPLAVALNLLELLREAVCTAFRALFRKRAAPETAPETAEPSSPPVSRREFLGAAVALTPPALSLVLSGLAYEQISRFRIRRFDLILPQLPRELDGMTIAHVSDTHVGRFSHGKLLQKVTETTNALKADMVLFTGDLINDSLVWLPQATEMLRQIDRPVFLCESSRTLRMCERIGENDEVAALFHWHLVFFGALAATIDLSIGQRILAKVMRRKGPFPTRQGGILKHGLELRFEQCGIEKQKERRRGI